MILPGSIYSIRYSLCFDRYCSTRTVKVLRISLSRWHKRKQSCPLPYQESI